MRELVLKVLTEQTTAISLAELEHKFHKADKVTLFRTLKTFEENKLIHSIDDGTGSVKYALCTETCQCNPETLHVHFFCTTCQHTYCLNDIPIPSVNLPVHFNLESISYGSQRNMLKLQKVTLQLGCMNFYITFAVYSNI